MAEKKSSTRKSSNRSTRKSSNRSARKSSNTSAKNNASATSEGAGSAPQADVRTNTWFADKDFAHYRELILSRRMEAVEDIERMNTQLDDVVSQAENDTAYSFHMADAGTDAMEREKLYLMLARQKKYVGYLDRALERIKNKTYGICRVTGKEISRERLEAVPHTEMSIEGKARQKR